MKCIVGLGNPGDKYAHNRHNVGFMVMDRLLAKIIKDQTSNIRHFSNNKKFNAEIMIEQNYIVVKPSTFMNESGQAVAAITQFYKIKNDDLYIVHDDLDITLGNYKIQLAKGPLIHYGVNSVEEKLGSSDFWRVRVGVENREVRGNKGIPGEVYSLQNFDEQEQKILDGVIESICQEMTVALQGETS